MKTAKFGNLRQRDLQILQMQHRKVLTVLGELLASGEVQAAVAAGSISKDDAERLLGYYATLGRQRMENIFGHASEEEVGNLWLLAKYAEQIGMVVSDKTINEFLKGLTHNAVKASVFQEVFRRNGFTSITQFFALLRDELLARQVQTEFQISLIAATPAQRWDYFTRVKRQATIEAIPVAVADYVKQVPDPSDDELRKFFEENKEKIS